MSDVRQDLGYTGKSHPGPRASRHAWALQERDRHIERHRCTLCGLTRWRTSHSDRFPTNRYRTAAGIESAGKAPGCTR